MDVLLAPVFQSFLDEREACLKHGGFVVGPMGPNTAGTLFEECLERGSIQDPEHPTRFAFSPMLPGVVYESHPTGGAGGFRYVGLIDEIEINNTNSRYRYEQMKPGRGVAGEKADDERMPAFVRFRVLVRISDTVPGLQEIKAGHLGQSTAVLRKFKFGHLGRSDLRKAIERLLQSTELPGLPPG